MIKRILVPTDFSDCSVNAIRYAIKLTEKLQADEMILLNAYTDPVTFADLNMPYNIGEESTQVEIAVDKEISRLKKQVPELESIKYQIVKQEGYLNDVVLELCLKMQIDLIVMGTQGATGIDEVVLGTNAHRIIKEQICPVLVVPEEAKFNSIQNIALSSDYKGIMAALLAPLKAIRDACWATIHVVHISDKGILEIEKAAAAKSLERYLKDLPHQYNFMVDTNIELGLENFARAKNIDLMVIYPRKKGLFERLFGKSESKSIIFHSKIPLLALSPYKKAKH